MNGALRLFVFVEGEGEMSAVPSLMHRIWARADSSFYVGVKPYRIKRDKFLNDSEYRKKHLKIARQVGEKGWSVVILLDAEEECFKDSTSAENMETIRADITKILSGVPHLWAMAEKGYESWLVAGFDGDSPGNPSAWINEHYQKLGLSGQYKKTAHQKKLTSKFDVEMAAGENCSFRRFRDWVLARRTAA